MSIHSSDRSTHAASSIDRPGEPRRLSRVFAEKVVTPPAISATTMWAFCGWIGFVSGLLESGLHLGWRHFGPRVGDPNLWVNWHKPWMAPLALATYGFALGIVASLFAQITPRTTVRSIPYAVICMGVWSILGVIPGLAIWAVWLLCAGVSVRLGSIARFDSIGFRRVATRSLPYMGGLWLLLFVGTGVYPTVRESWALTTTPCPQGNQPNVLMVVLDTVRADNLSMYGYDRETSPNLKRWSSRGVRFENARSTSPFTLGTHTSLFTGLMMSQTSAGVSSPLDNQRRTLAEELRDRGYATAGFTGNIFYGSAQYGLDRGFLHYHDIPGNILRRVTIRELLRSCQLGDSLITYLERRWKILAPMQRMRLEAGELNREALTWVDDNSDSKRPFFLFLNYFDAHSPFRLPGYAPQPYSRVSIEVLKKKMEQLERLEERHDKDPDEVEPDELLKLRTEVNAFIKDAYDDGITWVDRKLDELLQELDRRGILKNTLVVITADHGEMLGEHNMIGHGNNLDRQVVHVPLMIMGPESLKIPAGLQIEQPVSLKDVPATIMGLLGKGGANPLPGKSLSNLWTGAGGEQEPVVTEVEHMPWLERTPRMPVGYGPMWLMTERNWSYRRQNHEKQGMQEQLFNIESDPGELRDLADDPDHQAQLLTLRARLDHAYSTMTVPARPSLNGLWNRSE